MAHDCTKHPLSRRCLRLTLLSLFLVPIRLVAQQSSLGFDHLSVDNGLSHNIINSIAQDRFGFIWIGTQNGLNRYDGNTVKVYRARPTDSTSLHRSEVTSLVLDQEGVSGSQRDFSTGMIPNRTLLFAISPIRQEHAGRMVSPSVSRMTHGVTFGSWGGERWIGTTYIQESSRQ